jgi:PHD/YefM family antitoxin component YafN of YafNO toxin-antitoxin module
MIETTYTNLRQNLASVLDRVANDREAIVIRRRGEQKVNGDGAPLAFSAKRSAIAFRFAASGKP